MRKHVWFWTTILLAALSLVASALLFVDYVRPLPVFCAADGGCAKVQATVVARPLGVPLPAIGISGILAVGLAALVSGRRARIGQAGLGVAAGLVGLALLGVQAYMGELCPFCVVVDVSAIGLAGLSVARFVKGWDAPSGRLVTGGTIGSLVAAIVAPVAVGLTMRGAGSGLPTVIAEEMAKTGRGRVTVVDFVDFECPFCRLMHAELEPLIEARRSKIRLVRKHVPLRIHPHALDAAKAGCCAEKLGKGDAMADALFRTPPEKLDAEGCEKLAEELSLDLAAFRQCVSDPATTDKIREDREAFRAVQGSGLPTLWIDGLKLEGAQDRETLEAALDAAIRRL